MITLKESTISYLRIRKEELKRKKIYIRELLEIEIPRQEKVISKLEKEIIELEKVLENIEVK